MVPRKAVRVATPLWITAAQGSFFKNTPSIAPAGNCCSAQKGNFVQSHKDHACPFCARFSKKHLSLDGKCGDSYLYHKKRLTFVLKVTEDQEEAEFGMQYEVMNSACIRVDVLGVRSPDQVEE